jgi:hypothetical protein
MITNRARLELRKVEKELTRLGDDLPLCLSSFTFDRG